MINFSAALQLVMIADIKYVPVYLKLFVNIYLFICSLVFRGAGWLVGWLVGHLEKVTFRVLNGN